MPTYEYRCAEGHEFEAFQKMSDEPLAECPECGAAAERKISAGAGLVFKGSGFYITDYKNAGDGKRKAGEQAAKKEAGGSGDGGGGSSGAGEDAASGSSGGSGGSAGATGGGKERSPDD